MVCNVILIRSKSWWSEMVVHQNAVSVLKCGFSWSAWCSQIWAIRGWLTVKRDVNSLAVKRDANIKYSKESLAGKKSFFFSFFFFNTISLPSMLFYNPPVFCVAPADYSMYQRTQNALCRIIFSFFDGYAVNIAVHSFVGILLSFHTHCKHLLNELAFFIGL